MKRKVQIAVVTATSVALLSWGAFMAAQNVVVNGGQATSPTNVELNTSSPNWKLLSEDVGLINPDQWAPGRNRSGQTPRLDVYFSHGESGTEPR